MSRRPGSKAQLALLGDVLKLLRQRQRPVESVLIRPDGTIEVRLVRSKTIVDDQNLAGSWAEYDAMNE